MSLFKKNHLHFLFIILSFLTLPFIANAMSAPEEIRDSTKSTMSTPKQSPTPTKAKHEIMPPPRKTPKPHNMEPPIAPMTDPQAIKKLPPTEPPVPGADPRVD